MLNVTLAGGHLYGKHLFTWLSLVVSLMASFELSFFPLDVLDEIWDLIESVSEGFLTYSCKNIIIAQPLKVILYNFIFDNKGLRNFKAHYFKIIIKTDIKITRMLRAYEHVKLC